MRTVTCSTARTVVADPALDDALDRIAQLTARLHAVADLHGPRRTLLGGRVCKACARAFPCPTSQASRGQLRTPAPGSGPPPAG